ncbi:hypothetical protein BD410DRAFT_723013, partial [Rickenella mellea]
MTRLSFDDVLGTNYVPTRHERRLLATVIQSKQQKLSSLNNAIASLFAKRKILNDDVLAHMALLIPARHFPSELLIEVFIHSIDCLQPTQGIFGRPALRLPRPSVKQAPLVLGRICRRWRKIALSTPSLW